MLRQRTAGAVTSPLVASCRLTGLSITRKTMALPAASVLFALAINLGATSSLVVAQRLFAASPRPAAAEQVPPLPTDAPTPSLFLPTPASGSNDIATPVPGPGDLARRWMEMKLRQQVPSFSVGSLKGSVNLLSSNASCTAVGIDTRISGSGTWNGTGLFVGNGTFASAAGQRKAIFTLANATFTGNASQGCIGGGLFTTDDPESSLAGNGTAVGNGTFHFPQGLVTGSGKFEGEDLFFTDGSSNLTTDHGSLYGEGAAEGHLIICTGTGRMQGVGSFEGTGSFEGEGYFHAINAGNTATFLGSGLLTGDGECQSGDVKQLSSGEKGGPEIVKSIAYGDFVYGATLIAQAHALQPYAKFSAAPTPALILPPHAAHSPFQTAAATSTLSADARKAGTSSAAAPDTAPPMEAAPVAAVPVAGTSIAPTLSRHSRSVSG